MNGEYNRFVFDTNTVINFLEGRTAALPAGKRFVSIITEMELLAHPALTEEQELAIWRFLNAVTIVPLSMTIKQEAIQIRRAGSPRLKLPDAIVAATAVVIEAKLVTNDIDMLKLAWQGLTVCSANQSGCP